MTAGVESGQAPAPGPGIPPPVPPRKVPAGTIIAILMISVGLISAVFINVRRHLDAEAIRKAEAGAPKSADDLQTFGDAPVAEFSLTRDGGKTVTLADLKGRVWVADTFFTYCGSICTRMTPQFAKLHREFVGKDEPKFVSISVDPMRDTPRALEEHARTHQADPERWWFLTGDPKAIQGLTSSLLLTYEIGVPSSHNDRFVLVDRDGRIRGSYHGTDDTDLEQLRRDLRLLLAAPKKQN